MTDIKQVLLIIAVLVVSYISAGAFCNTEDTIDRSSLEIAPRIIGGYYVPSIRLAPYMVFLLINMDNSPEYGCTGTIISPRHVLTAAHCTKGTDVTLDVYLGTLYPDLENGRFTSCKRFKAHPKFKVKDEKNQCSYNHDLAILKLNKPLRFNDRVNSIRLPSLNAANKGRWKHCTVAGWGWTRPEGNSLKPLKAATVKIIGDRKCSKNLEHFTPKNDLCRKTQICTEHPHNNNNPCHGDSGGPLICDGVQIGLTSWSGNYSCVGETQVTIYTSLRPHLKWIYNTMSKY